METSTGGFGYGGGAHKPAHLVAELPAEYDKAGAPTNVAAKREVALMWTTAVTGSKPRVVQLPYLELAHATDSFSDFNNIGGGASCAVFTGRIFGVPVAIKRLSLVSNPGATDRNPSADWEAKQFTAESQLLCRVTHVNICRMLAFSIDGPERCLVLQLCTGGTLSDRLACKPPAGRPPPDPLGWQQRVHIAHGVASALEYLHGLLPQMIHRQEDHSHPSPPSAS